MKLYRFSASTLIVRVEYYSGLLFIILLQYFTTKYPRSLLELLRPLYYSLIELPLKVAKGTLRIRIGFGTGQAA